ncbi:MAG: translation initiation factor IF-2 [Blastocatellia bacterium]
MGNKVRIYDLAKELKLESKKVLDDARMMGVDVNVASNSVDDIIAARIREKYYPKKEPTAASPRARLIKHPVATPAPTPDLTPIPEAGETPPAAPAVGAVPVSASVPETAGAGGLSGDENKAPTTQVRILKPPPSVPVPVPPPQEPILERVETQSVEEIAPVGVEPAATVEAEPTPSPVVEPVPSAQPLGTTRILTRKLTPPTSRPSELLPTAQEAAQQPEGPTVAPAGPEGIAAADVAGEPGTAELPSGPPLAPKAPPSSPQGTVVRRLATPTRPAPAPPVVPRPRPTPSTAPTGRFGRQPVSREAGREPATARGDQGKGVHILPSGAQQVKVYIPPKDQRPQGRHQKRKEKEQEGQQRQAPRRIAPYAQPVDRQLPTELRPLRLVEGSSVREFAEKIQAKPRDLVSQLMQRGIMATINQPINPQLAVEIGKEYGWEVTYGEFEDMLIESEFEITPEFMEDTDLRAPVVTVMGHVDHGKTSLLDAIRSTRVAEGEAGGITQHIGAYSVEVPNPDQPEELRRVVFLDTPGHEAFTMMRARGARVTDIVILVVAADDGVMPQTVEAIEHARAAGVPIIVAINKIDKPDANPDRVRKELANRGLLWTSWGGDTEMVEVSAKNRINIEGLLEMILLTADVIELKANPRRRATGTVLEAKLDRGRGAVATVLIQNGSLRVGEPFIVGNFFGKVRALMNDLGDRVEQVGPATPVEVLGLEGVPAAGDQFQVVDEISKAQQISGYRQSHARAAALARSAARGLDQLRLQMEAGAVKELLVILKTDVQGSVEVLKDTLLKLSTDKVKVRIIRSGVGAITESDVLLASASQATESGAVTVIIGFNVRPETRAEEIARQEQVDVRLHSIIYKVEEEIRSAMLGLMDATTREQVIGKAEIRDVIRIPKIGAIAGCMVTNGYLKRGALARLIRDNVVIFESQLGSLRRFKEDVAEVQQGYECGLTVERFSDYKIGDIVEAYLTEKVAPTQL